MWRSMLKCLGGGGENGRVGVSGSMVTSNAEPTRDPLNPRRLAKSGRCDEKKADGVGDGIGEIGGELFPDIDGVSEVLEVDPSD